MPTTSATADSRYKGPGWYAVWVDDVVFITAGPFDSKKACEASKSPDGYCEYLTHDAGYHSDDPG